MNSVSRRPGAAALLALALCASVPGLGAAVAGEGVSEDLMKHGEELFLVNCRQCHGTRGTAGTPLANNAHLEDSALIAKTIVKGRGYMTPFGEHLDDEQIAAIATFIRNNWGNEYGPVAADDVAAVR